MHSHNLPLVAVLWLPALLAALRRLPGMDHRWARLDPFSRAALLAMAIAAAVHLALIPAHLHDVPTAVLFALDAAGLAALGGAALVALPHWRPAAALLLLGAVGAYAVYIASGREVLDLTGIATKVDEVAGAELLLLGHLARTRLSQSLPSRPRWKPQGQVRNSPPVS